MLKNKILFLKTIILINLIISTIGCSVFTHYTSKMRPVKTAVINGDLVTATEVFPEKKLESGNDRLCYLLEKGTLEQMNARYADSNKVFDEAAGINYENDMRAKIAIGKILEGGGSLLINDKVMAYEGEPYERVFMHTLQAINYLMQDNKSGARVEIKRAYEQSKALAELREKEIENSREYAKSKGIEERKLLSTAHTAIFGQKTLNEMRKQAADPYQNAFTSYLSSLVYEMNGDYNDAYIDCKAAYDINPEAKLPAENLARLAALSGMNDRKEEWEKKFGSTAPIGKNYGEAAVFFQCGISANKEQIWFPVPVPIYDSHSRSYAIVSVNISFPRYVETKFAAERLDLFSGNMQLCSTEILSSLDTIAVQNFYDHIPSMLIRLCVRASIKAASAYAARDQLGQVGPVDVSSLLVSGVNAFTEQADLRSWLLTPSNLQCARFQLPAGENSIDFILRGKNGESIGKRTVKINIEPQKFTIINLRAIDDFVGDIQVSKPM